MAEPSGFSERLMLVLTAKGLVPSDVASEVLAEARGRRVLVEQVLAEKRLVSSDKVTEALAGSFELTPYYLTSAPIDPAAQALIPFEKAWEHQIVPVGFSGEELVVVAAQPGSDFVRNYLEELTGKRIRYAICDRLSLRRALARYPGAERYRTVPGRDSSQHAPRQPQRASSAETRVPDEEVQADAPHDSGELQAPETEDSAAQPASLEVPGQASSEPEAPPAEQPEEESAEADDSLELELDLPDEKPAERRRFETAPLDEGDFAVPSLPELDLNFDDLDDELEVPATESVSAPPEVEPEPEPEPEPEREPEPPQPTSSPLEPDLDLSVPELPSDEFELDEPEPATPAAPLPDYSTAPAPAPVSPPPAISQAGGGAATAVAPPPKIEVASLADDGLLGGRFRLVEPLMECRFSTLFRANDQVLGHPLVLRKLEGTYAFLDSTNGQKPLQREARLQILREGRTLHRLRHRNLPRVRGTFEQESDIYLVLDDMPGQSLEEFQRNFGAALPGEVLERYLDQFLSVLEYLHGQSSPIIHRDLRPDTVLVTPHGVLKVGEFGLAKMLEDAGKKDGTSFRSQGNPHFASPEQLMGEASHPRHDLYSVGAILYYLATGTTPPESMKAMYGQEAVVPIEELRPDIPPQLAATITALMAPDPEQRPDSVAAVRALHDKGERPTPLPQLLLELQQGEEPDAPLQQAEPSRETGSRPPRRKSLREEKGFAAKVKRSSMWQLLFGDKPDEQEAVAESEDAETAPLEAEVDDRVPYVDLAAISLDKEVGQTLSEALSRTIEGVCIGRLSATEITVACKDPTDVHIYDNIAMAAASEFRASLVRGDADLIDHALDYIFRSQHLSSDTSWGVYLEQKRLDSEVLQTTSQSASVNFGDEALEGPVVETVDRLIKEAISAGASDIHLEPFETGMDMRYRIDGVLRKVNHFSKEQMTALVKRIKVMGNMDIAQERVTQGGRISLRIGTKEFDLRVSIVPVPVGESVVMRVLKKGAFTLTLSDLGFAPDREAKYREILSQPYGMILVCGPTGSGKSTTLYASLKEIARPDRKLLTVEDPIEYQMPGIIQVQVNTAPREEEKKVTFSRALREFLRQDPDVILVGEIRDQETAEIGIQAALTGHLLLSTIHTNDSIGIVARLRDMECEPFLIGSVLLGGLAQRLARRICPNCCESVPVPPEYAHLFHEQGYDNPKAFKGMGCRECNETGTRGRVGLYELLEITPEIRALINSSALEEELRKTALEQGFKPLLADGIEKVQTGMVSLEEVLRVCKTV